MSNLLNQVSNFFMNLIKLGILLIILCFVLVYFGYITCCDIPFINFCFIYHTIFPDNGNVLILYGKEGIGDPEKLKQLIIERTNKFPIMLDIDLINNVNQLKGYSVVFVEHARKLSNKKLEVLKQYVLQTGGKLVIIGDVGTELGDNDYYCQKAELLCKIKPKTNNNNTLGGMYIQTQKVVLSYPKNDIGYVCVKNISNITNVIISLKNKIIDELKKDYANSAEISCDVVKPDSAFSKWKRQVTIDENGNVIPGIDFGKEVVLLNYIGTIYNQTTYIYPVAKNNRLGKGYTFDKIKYHGNFSLVSNEGFLNDINSVVVMNLKYHGKYYPAVVYSNPTGYDITTGRVVYFAFPIEEFPSKTIINNLFDFIECSK